MILPVAVNAAITQIFRSSAPAVLGRGGGLVMALLLSSCGTLPWQTEDPVRPMARRRAVPTSQRREARMARPSAQAGQPVVDYDAYKRISPGMELAEVQSLLKQAGQAYEVAAGQTALGKEQQDEAAEQFWRWTHPSGVYNIHVRLVAGAQPETWMVQSKWLTYNPPE